MADASSGCQSHSNLTYMLKILDIVRAGAGYGSRLWHDQCNNKNSPMHASMDFGTSSNPKLEFDDSMHQRKSFEFFIYLFIFLFDFKSDHKRRVFNLTNLKSRLKVTNRVMLPVMHTVQQSYA